jgi:hypothetical protein
VFTNPGEMALTWIPFEAHSLLNALVIWSTPPFEQAYAETL